MTGNDLVLLSAGVVIVVALLWGAWLELGRNERRVPKNDWNAFRKRYPAWGADLERRSLIPPKRPGRG